jgi:hypothetical protein
MHFCAIFERFYKIWKNFVAVVGVIFFLERLAERSRVRRKKKKKKKKKIGIFQTNFSHHFSHQCARILDDFEAF